MIRWILEGVLGTLPFEEVEVSLPKAKILDVRDLVDKNGNQPHVVRNKIKQAVLWLTNGDTVLICCDHGISRSNAIATGVLSVYRNIEIDDAIKIVVETTKEKAIKLEVLRSVRLALTPPKNDEREQKNIVMTGASGFIGRTLIKQLELVREICAPSHEEIDLLSDTITLDVLVKKQNAEILIHLGAPTIINNNQSLSESLLMLINVLDVCRENNLRLIFISSWEVYSGYKTGIQYVDETVKARASTIFGMTKLLSEELILQYADSFGLSHVILRPTVIYGVGSSKPRFLNNFINKAKKNEVITTHEYLNGLPFLDMLHVNDIVQFVQKSLDSTSQGVFNLGSSELISTKIIAESIIQQLASKSVIESVQIQETTGKIKYNIDRAKKEMGWQPRISWQDGLATLL